MASPVDPNMPPSESDSDWASDSQAMEAGPPLPPPPKKKKTERRKATQKRDVTALDKPDPSFDPSEHQLPRELLDLTQEQTFDVDDEDMSEDHVGFWRDEDRDVLVKALNHYRKDLKGNFEGCGGGKAKRVRAWEKVVEHVNQRCKTKWNVSQAQGKASRYAKEVKAKYNALRRAKQRTGGGVITDDMYLTPIEQSMLDYVGVEGVVETQEDINFRSLFQRMTDKRLSALAARMIGNSSIPQCASECVRETAFQCKSFDFDNKRRACVLYKVNLDDRDIHFIPTPGMDHYKTNYVKLYHRIPNHMLSRSHNRRIDEVAVEECARRCMLETYFKCRGFDYEKVSRTCWLTERTPQDTGGINMQNGWDYYQRNPEGPLMRFINYGYGRLKPLQSAEVYQKVVMGISLEYCATLCLAATASSFHCLSFDYVFNGGVQDTCHMSKYIGANVYGLVASQDQRVMHFEKKEKYLAFFYATPYSVVLGNNQRTFTHVTPNRCARMCMQEEGFVCRSFDYRIEEGTCLLSTKTGSDVGGLYNQGLEEVHHFEMKPIMDCGGNLTAPDGNIASPNWPRSYAPNEQCLWQITVPKHKVIRFHFSHLDLGLKYHNPCSEREDRVTITEILPSGPHEFCVLPNTKTYITPTNVALVAFYSNDEIDGQGFRAFYSAEWTCDVHLSSAPGEVASPSWPDPYPPSTRCSWRITAPPRHRVSLRVTHFQLERHSLGHCNTEFDHLTILDGGTVRSPQIGLYCGRTPAFTVRSTGRDMFVQFISDATDARPGFHAIYNFEFSNGTADADLDFRQDVIEPLDGTAVLEGEDPEINHVPGDPSADKHVQPDDQPNIAGVKDAQGGEGSDKAGNAQYRSTLWAVLTTLLVVVIALSVILFLLWRHYRGRLTKQRQIVTDETPAEEVPLQEQCCSKPNNEDYNGPSTSHNATQFTNLLYGDAEKKVNIKNINLDAKC